jgi:hypothetical protein
VFAAFEVHPAQELRHELDGRTYNVMIQDLRGLSFTDMFASGGVRSATGECQEPKAAHTAGSTLAAIGQEEFGAHVREALRTFHDPLALTSNPLIQSRVVGARSASGTCARERANTLRVLLAEESEVLRGTPRGDTLYRVLEAAYLKPVGKHEGAAEAMGMSYSTFRRRLTEATQHLIAALWERELA